MGVFSLESPLSPLQPLFSTDLEIVGSEVVRGWTIERGVYLGKCDLFVCTGAQYPSSSFLFSSYYVTPPPTLSLLFIPHWDPIPLSDGLGAVAVTLALAVKEGGPTSHSITSLTLPFTK